MMTAGAAAKPAQTKGRRHMLVAAAAANADLYGGLNAAPVANVGQAAGRRQMLQTAPPVAAGWSACPLSVAAAKTA